MADRPRTIHAYCRRILESGDLETKLAGPHGGPDVPALDDPASPALHIDRPARDAGLELSSGAAPLPRPEALDDVPARALCLARFAHHELMAAELFAWALLRWPEADPRLRRAWLGALAEEQEHCRLYLDRLTAHGYGFTDFDHSAYFWKQADAVATSAAGPRAFLAGIGLTLEQANLDFTLIYRDGFRRVGDEATAQVCERVHDDEIGHVALAHGWLGRLSAPGTPSIEAFEDAVPFPLSAARAKGRRFHPEPRRRAGLDDAFIAHVRSARSSQERGRGGRSRAETSKARDPEVGGR